MIDNNEFFNTLLNEYEQHGSSAIDRLAKENPVAYL